MTLFERCCSARMPFCGPVTSGSVPTSARSSASMAAGAASRTTGCPAAQLVASRKRSRRLEAACLVDAGATAINASRRRPGVRRSAMVSSPAPGPSASLSANFSARTGPAAIVAEPNPPRRAASPSSDTRSSTRSRSSSAPDSVIECSGSPIDPPRPPSALAARAAGLCRIQRDPAIRLRSGGAERANVSAASAPGHVRIWNGRSNSPASA